MLPKIYRRLSFLSIALLIAGGLLIYSNTYSCSWHFDDMSYIVNNPTIRTLADMPSIWNRLSAPGRTVVLYTFALNYHFGKTDVFGYHVVNNMIHIITAVLVYWMSAQLFKTPRIQYLNMAKHRNMLSLFAALIFLSHPIQTQAVTYICQRFASLATLFYVASVCFYLKGRLSTKGVTAWFILCSLAALLGMFSKQITLTLPVSIILVEWLFFSTADPRKGRINLRLMIPLLAFLLIIPALYSFNARGILSISHASSGSFPGDRVDVYSYPLTQLRVIPTYIKLLFFPVGQNLIHEFPTSKSFWEWKTAGGFIFIVAILAGAYKLRKKMTLLSFGIFWFFLTLSVESGVIPIRHVIFEHRVYLPSVGFSIFLVYAAYAVFKNQTRMMVALSVFVLTLSCLTYQRNKVWLNEFTLWADVKRKSPNEMRAYLNTGIAYTQREEYGKAMKEFDKALELSPRSVMVFNNKGLVYTKQHLFDEAIMEFNKALAVSPVWEEVWNNRGDAYRHKSEYEAALADYNKALDINPGLYRALSNRGVMYTHLGRHDLALADFNQAIRTDPDFIEAYQNRGNLYGITKKYDLAVKDFTKAIQAAPDTPQLYNNRGNAYRYLSEYELAFQDYTKAIELDPSFSEGYNNRGVIYRHWKKMDQALNDYNKAIALNPVYVNAYNNRGNLFQQQGQYGLALEDFNTALSIEPDNKIVYYNRAKTRIGQKDFANALKDARQAEELGYSPAGAMIKQLNQRPHGL